MESRRIDSQLDVVVYGAAGRTGRAVSKALVAMGSSVALAPVHTGGGAAGGRPRGRPALP